MTRHTGERLRDLAQDEPPRLESRLVDKPARREGDGHDAAVSPLPSGRFVMPGDELGPVVQGLAPERDGGEIARVVAAMWAEVLGDDAREDRSFIANGGDSFHAVVLSARLQEEHAIEVDYLTILEAEHVAAVVQAAGDPASG